MATFEEWAGLAAPLVINEVEPGRIGPLHWGWVPLQWVRVRVACGFIGSGSESETMATVDLYRHDYLSVVWGVPLRHESFVYTGHCPHCGLVHWALSEPRRVLD